jgi:hypothetical protein
MRISSLLLLFLFFFFACKKDNIEETPPKPSEVLSPGHWQLKKLTIESPPGSGAADITSATFDPCELDDLFEFKTGGNFSCVENTNVCAFNTGVFYNLSGGMWALSGDTLLSIAKGFNAQNFKFGKIAANSIELQQTSTNYLGELTRYTFLINK